MGTLVFEVTVNDADINNQVLSVDCINNPASVTACDTFMVNTTTATNRLWTGKIYLKKELDYESGTKLYQLLLQAKVGIFYGFATGFSILMLHSAKLGSLLYTKSCSLIHLSDFTELFNLMATLNFILSS